VLPLHWSGEPFDYAGKHFNARGIIGRPRPVQIPIPIWIGGNAKLTLRRIGERAQGWMPLVGPLDMTSTVRSPHVGSVEAIIERLTLLREYAGDRFDSLDIVVPHVDDTVHDTSTSANIARNREAFEAYAAMGATWCVVPGPPGVAPRARDFLQAFGETYIGAVR
jgi:alkanesulfonate monooxygenase SsuD/methylene tetrahydromethanopterin reductase-like flavin-dependent oxidoreductase (luciferase family)